MAHLSIRAITATRSPSLRNGWLPGVALVLLAGTVNAAPQRCPATLEVEQHAIGVPAGAQAFDAEPRHPWTNVQFSDGPPNEQAWLAPDATRKAGKSFVNAWTFTSPDTWMACGYTGTSVILAFRLADSIRSCEVRYDAGVSPPAATTVDCR